MSRILGISRSGDYDRQSRKSSARGKAEVPLKVAIWAAHVCSCETCGPRRLQPEELAEEGFFSGRNLIAHAPRGGRARQAKAQVQGDDAF